MRTSFCRRCTSTALLVVALWCMPNLAYSQFRTPGGTQSEDCSVPTLGLSHIPQLRTDMPLDCFIGYVFLDSIARSAGIETAIRYPQNMDIGQLRAFSRFIYGMADYDPLLLLRHFTSTLDSSFPNKQYRSYPANFYFNLLLEVQKRKEEFGKVHALLTLSSYVLHVRVTDVRSGIDSSLKPINRVNVACTVVESFKGKTLPDNCRFAATTNDKRESTLASPSCLVYGHTAHGYIPKAGEEFLIFLFIQPTTKEYAILYPMIGSEATGGRFQIADGKVNDPSNFFGLGTNPSLSDCKATLHKAIQDIRSWTWQ